MEKRAYSPQETSQLQLKTERVGSDAFTIEYGHSASDAAIKDDIISYLGEYRFQLQKFNYEFLLNSKGFICESKDKEPMRIKNMRAIAKKREEGRLSSREDAELLGMVRLEDQLRTSEVGSTLFWGSPPGPKEDGYGEYGFIYVGKVREDQGRKKLEMTAIRVEHPTIEQYKKAMNFLTNTNNQYSKAEDFLKSPIVVKEDINLHFVDRVLSHMFPFSNDHTSQDQFDRVIKKLNPLINDVIAIFRVGSPSEKLKAWYTLENYAIELREGKEGSGETIVYEKSTPELRLVDMSGRYGYEPPVAKGSCGSSSENKSNNPFSFGFEFLKEGLLGKTEDKYGTREVECPSCNKMNMREENKLLSKCQHCGSDKIAC